mgnify:CR=1 FL=1
MDDLKKTSLSAATVQNDDGLHMPELLAPAGDWDCVKAAVENGADAIYFGLDRFNARMRANNFTEADLPRLMEFLHLRGVKGYVTFNTLVFSDELAEAEQYLRVLIHAGVDAVLVQDVGICRLIRSLSPDLPIHGSTQMTVTSVEGIRMACELGCSRVVLARECSLKDIEAINQGIAELRAKGKRISLECFVHGALCVAYSGQCLTSEALGGRSANRGECAQACRMAYKLISDGQLVPLGDRQYLLSPQDLSALELLPDLIKAGVEALKIEGRLKSPEYVANITRIYRHALDTLSSSKNGPDAGFSDLCKKSRYDLEMAFSRGLFTGWLKGTNNRALVHARFGKKRGVFLGIVDRVEREVVHLKLEAPLKPGDGIVFDSGHPEQEEEGGRVYSVKELGRGAGVAIGFGHGDIHFSRVHLGDRVWKTSDPELDRRLRQSFDGDKPLFQRPLAFEVNGREGEPLILAVRDDENNVAEVKSQMPLAHAQKQPLSADRLKEQLGRLGGTPFKMGKFTNGLNGEVILPMSELNRMRREAVALLDATRRKPLQWSSITQGNSGAQNPAVSHPLTAQNNPVDANLVALVRDVEQFNAALESGICALYCDFEDPKLYRDAVKRFRETCASGASIFVAPPRVYKPGEEWILKQVRSSDADGYLARNYDHLKYFAGEHMVGDFSLNMANGLSAAYFLNQFKLERIVASYDLNMTQLEALLRSAPANWFEVTIHQHMPMFHMEHCVFCAFLSQGSDYTNCGRPCDKHKVRLRDRVGAEHPVKADAGCRNTVYNGRAQTGAEYASKLMELGVRWFRVEFVNESRAEVLSTISKYQSLLKGTISGSEVWRELKLINQLGVTRGQMGGK